MKEHRLYKNKEANCNHSVINRRFKEITIFSIILKEKQSEVGYISKPTRCSLFYNLVALSRN